MSDLPEKPRGSKPYLPPPPETREDSPGSLHFPRMEPPPASLEALMRNGPRATLHRSRSSSWVWVLGLLAAVAAAAYFMGLHR